jgi:PAS domain-containing protein
VHDETEHDTLMLNNTRAMLYVPMAIDKKLWGFVGIECIRKGRTWNDRDILYMQSATRIIGVGIRHFRTEELRQRSDLKFGYLYRSMPLGICLFNKDAILSDVNEVFLKLAGVSDKSEILGKSIYQFRSMPKDVVGTLSREEEVSFDFQLLPSQWNEGAITTRHTSVHYFTVHIKVLRNINNNTLSGYMMVWVDNTQVVRSQQKVAEVESLFLYTSNIAKIGVGQWNPLTQTGFATEQWFRNFNEPTDGNLKDIICTQNTVHPEDRAKMFDYLEKAKAGKATMFNRVVRVWNENQWRRLRLHSKVRVFDPENKKIDLVCMSIDINDQLNNNLPEEGDS